jgi:uncharacterized coiled-coil protein SlyX
MKRNDLKKMSQHKFMRLAEMETKLAFEKVQELKQKVEMQNGFKEEDRKNLAELTDTFKRWKGAMQIIGPVLAHPDCDPDAPVPKEIIDILNPKERLRTEKEQSQDNTRPGR